MTPGERAQIVTLAFHTAIIVIVIVATTVLAMTSHLDQAATAILSGAFGVSGSRAAQISTRQRRSDELNGGRSNDHSP